MASKVIKSDLKTFLESINKTSKVKRNGKKIRFHFVMRKR